MIYKKGLVCILLWGLSLIADAQPLGNEWVKPYQPYYKIRILQQGVYRLSGAVAESAGLPIASVNPSRIQLFALGVEQPLFLHGMQDGVWNEADFIEFYASGFGGGLDSQLYQNPADHPHPYQSFFSDTGFYFLTILPDTTSVSPLRYSTFFENNYSAYSPEPYYMHQSVFFSTQEYFDGINLNPNSDKYNTSEYTEGEGWGTARIGLGQTAVYPINTPYFQSGGPAPVLSVKLAGVSDYYLTNPVFNHHVVTSVAAADNQVYTIVDDRKYKGYVTQTFSTNLTASQMGSNTTLLRLQVVNDLQVLSDFNTLLFASISYPRSYELAQSTQAFAQISHLQAGFRSYVLWSQFGNGTKTTPLMLDMRSRKRIRGTWSSGNAQFIIEKQTQPSDVFVYDSTDAIPITAIERTVFFVPNTAINHQYLLVTHPAFADAAAAYTSYRSQKYNVLQIYTQQLYDYYTYGIPHPLAIKRFAKHLYTTQSEPPLYMLLLGKGYQTNLLKNTPVPITNFIPAIGVPAADNMFTTRLTQNGFEAQIPTGRIPATTNAQALNYLNKLMYYENPDDSLDSWRKQILHISGGNNANEQLTFKNQINAYGQIIQNPEFGSHVMTYNKSTNDPVQTNLQDELQAIINRGITMMTFLGHGSATLLDVSFGSIATMNNRNRYPLFYFNGCNIGNPSEIDPIVQPDIYGPEFICAANKGVIGWLAHSNLTLDGKLFAQMSQFYTHLNQTSYGESIGKIVQQTCADLTNGDEQMRSHCTQLTLQGDPAVRIFSPEYADFTISNTDVFTIPASPNASMDSFLLGVIVTNRGRAVNDSLDVSFTHILANNQVKPTQTKRIKAPYWTDTTYFTVKNEGTASIGNNTFTITLDPGNKLVEGNETNNQISVQRFLPGVGVTALLPEEFSIISNDTVVLTAQCNNINASDVSYTFEADTSIYFNSPFKQQNITQSGAIARWIFPLTPTDTTAFFWRVKLNNVQGAENVWSSSGFTYVPLANKGWAQSSFQQYTQASSKVFISIDSATQTIDFTEDNTFVTAKIARWAHAGMGIIESYPITTGVGACMGAAAIVAVVYDKRTLSRKELPGIPYTCTPGLDERYYAFDARTNQGKADFIRFIDSVETGDYVAMYSYYDAGINTWTPQVRQALASLGSVKAAQVQTYYSAFSLIGQKGAAPGSIVEDTIFNNRFEVQTPSDTTFAESNRMITGNWFEGKLISKRIGPAKAWGDISYQFASYENDGSDRNYVNVYAVKADLTDSLVGFRVQSGEDFSWLNPSLYPFIKLEMHLIDSVHRTPNQLKYWQASYTPVPEGAINLSLPNSFYNSVLQNGDSLSFSFAFQNISELALDSVRVDVSITDAARKVVYQYHEKLPPLIPEAYVQFRHKVNTLPMSGLHTMSMQVNAGRVVPELSLINNFLSRDFEVQSDNSSPILDVTFDGYRIANGDYVSPSPLISISSKDDNPFRLQADTGTFSLMIKRPGTNLFEAISYQSADVRFYPATESQNKARIEYQPQQLMNGIYTLRVQSTDATGNASGSNPYEIDFKVENKSTITHFFPYPNPGTTNIRFVFTLTGSKPPEELLIRIMTLSGKIVREIRRDEFGPIKIGQNVSDFAWDGTDQYGDRLANGVYLYQVFTRIDGSGIERAETKADKFFMHDTGKIYLLR